MRYADILAEMVAALPANPVSPENRGVARLRSSAWVMRGQVFRVLLELGAAPYLADTFGLSKTDARTVLSYWMQTFGQRQADASRAL